MNHEHSQKDAPKKNLLKTWTRKWRALPLFDPSLWPHRERLTRVAGTTACLAFIIHRLFRFEGYTGQVPPYIGSLLEILQGNRMPVKMVFTAADGYWIMWLGIWLIETGIFLGYVWSFISRTEAKQVAKGFMEVGFPFIVAALPIGIVLTPLHFRQTWMSWTGEWEPTLWVVLAFVLLGGMINLIGLWTLRRAFTITSEARVLIRRGPFSVVRHPLYTGHFIMFFGYLLLHLYWYTGFIYGLFLFGQYQRARIEERKLAAVFPEYAEYRQVTPMFFPKIIGKKKGSGVHGSRFTV